MDRQGRMGASPAGLSHGTDLRWRFAKDWNATFEKDETAVPIDAPASAVKRPAAAPSKPAAGDTSESPTKSATADSKIDSSTASSKKEAEKASDKPSQPEGPAYWDGFWPLTVADLLHRADKSSTGSTGPHAGDG